jgi:hypothetical protein
MMWIPAYRNPVVGRGAGSSGWAEAVEDDCRSRSVRREPRAPRYVSETRADEIVASFDDEATVSVK